MSLLTKIFGSRNQRLLKTLQKTVRDINALESALEQLSDDALKAKTPELKARLAAGATVDVSCPRHLRFVAKRVSVFLKCATLMCS